MTERFVSDLHRHMSGDVWRWAGEFRTSERNIGIPPYEIPVALRQLLADAAAWTEHKAWEADELAVRFHHRLVHIHPFANGKGRHSTPFDLPQQVAVLFLGRHFATERESVGAGGPLELCAQMGVYSL